MQSPKMPADSVYNVRHFELRDLDAVVEIERLCFSDPYPRQLFLELAKKTPRLFVVAVTSENRLVGYAIADHWEDHDHLVSIAVHSLFQRQGIGSILLEKLEDELDRSRLLRLEVRTSNKSAIAFYSKHGFEKTNIIRGYYADGEDALELEKKSPAVTHN